MYKNHPWTSHTILEKLKAIPRSRLVEIYAKSATAENSAVIPFLPHLEYMGCPDEALENFLDDVEGKTEAQVTEALIGLITHNCRLNKDLLDLNPTMLDSYVSLFGSLRRANRGDIEKAIIDKLRPDGLDNYIGGRPLLAAADSLVELAQAIRPDLEQKFISQYLTKRVLQPGYLSTMIKPWKRDGQDGIDVTQNNLRSVVLLMRMLAQSPEKETLAACNREFSSVFHDYTPMKSLSQSLLWFAYHFDVEEISLRRSFSVDTLASYMELQGMMQSIQNQASSRYLSNNLSNIQVAWNDGKPEAIGDLVDIERIEAVRLAVNSRNRVLGDQMIDAMATGFLEQQAEDVSRIPDLYRFALAWSGAGAIPVDRDVADLYEQHAFYAFNAIADALTREIDAGKEAGARSFLQSRGVNLDQVIADLEARGFSIRRQGNFSKGFGRLFTNPRYVARRSFQQFGSSDSRGYRLGAVTKKQTPWPGRPGVDALDLVYDGKTIAQVFKCQRSRIGVSVLAELSGVVDLDNTLRQMDGRYIFSAPMTMTGLGRKMTGFAFRDGMQMNWITKSQGDDGLLLADSAGGVRILDKRAIPLSALVNEEDIQKAPYRDIIENWARANRDRPQSSSEYLAMNLSPFKKLRDRRVFLDILKAKRYSVLSGMLLIDGEGENVFHDGRTSRRLFVEFSDQTFGVINSSEDMTTGDLVQLARHIGAKRAIYMDTGMYDMATYRDGRGTDHIIGHQDTDESTNRVVIFDKSK